MWWHGAWEGPGIIWGVLGTVASGLFWILLIAVVIKLVKSRPVAMGSPPSALRILEERYAAGEISREEFEERRDVLLGVPRRSETSPT